MSDHISLLIRRYERQGILIDTNVLLLLLIGSFDRELIRDFRRFSGTYVEEDYETLLVLLRRFNRIVTTPNILTEVNNLCGRPTAYLGEAYFVSLAQYITTLDERYIRSTDLARLDGFNSFGLTDCAIGELAARTFLVLTDDLRLYRHLEGRSIDVVNFNHLRPRAWV